MGVYRAANAEFVTRLQAPALEQGWDVAWWALDAEAPELGRHTVGCGPGWKFPLLNEIVSRMPSTGWLVVADDDLVFRSGDVVEFLAVCERARFDLAQPAHVPTSRFSHAHTVAQPGVVARRSTFVEIGPLFCVSAAIRDAVMPFPADSGMGWGLDVDWYELGMRGASLGIVDSVPIEHLAVAGETYDVAPYFARLREKLDRIGAAELTDVQRTLEVWHSSSPTPPW